MKRYIVFNDGITDSRRSELISSILAQCSSLRIPFYPIYSTIPYYELGQDTSKLPEGRVALFVYDKDVIYVSGDGEKKVVKNGKIVIPNIEIYGKSCPSMVLMQKSGRTVVQSSSYVGNRNASLSELFHSVDENEMTMSPVSGVHSWQEGMKLAYDGNEQLKKHDDEIRELQEQAFGSGIFEYSGEMPELTPEDFFDKYAFVMYGGVCYVRSSLSEGKASYSSSGDGKSVLLTYDGETFGFEDNMFSKVEATRVDIVW